MTDTVRIRFPALRNVLSLVWREALSERVFAQLIQLPLRFHLDRQTGAVTQALTNGLQGYQMILQALVFTVLRAQNPPPQPPAPTAARVEIMSSGGQHGSAVLSADSAFKSI